MSDKTGISWCDATWNPVRGCSRVSTGCKNCYAERVAARASDEGMPYHGLAKRTLLTKYVNGGAKNVHASRWTGVVRMVPEHLADPIRWKRPRRIFVNSMSDLFHESLTNEQIAAVFGVMAAAPQHTFQVLTKRAKRMREWFEWAREQAIEAGEDRPDYGLMLAGHAGSELGDGSSSDESEQQVAMQDRINDAWARDGKDGGTVWECPWPLPNVWLGVSVENQDAVDERIPELLATPAAVRFLSCEPLLGPVRIDGRRDGQAWKRPRFDALSPFGPIASIYKPRVDWVIVGCESGPSARPCSVEWLRSLRDQCAAANVALFLKQATHTPGVWMPPDDRGTQRSVVTKGDGSKTKAGGVIELPYLDGVQHAAFPEIK